MSSPRSRTCASPTTTRLTYAGNPANLAEVADDPRYAFVHGDIRDRARLTEVLPGHDAVVNFAAESHVDRSITGSDEFVSTNVVGANCVFWAAMQADVGRVLHISTDETYGSIAEPDSFREGRRPRAELAVLGGQGVGRPGSRAPTASRTTTRSR